ncbi:MAG: diaminopimelate epimerase [Gemmatimonadetes bacterium]|nr:diaminopimelate epimerase [Gemmatimonadota bacterium]
MTGSGNDFVMVDARVSTPADWTPADIRAACARGTGVGADGLVFVGPGSAPNSARMIYYNSDGSHARMCGNAALCSARLAARVGIAPGTGMRLETDAGIYDALATGDDPCAELHLAPVEPPRAVTGLAMGPGERRAALGIVGVPHLVVLVGNVDSVDLRSRGRALRFDSALAPDGANINFISQGRDPSEWRMRTYERGVEDETLACGTGAVAAACALHEWQLGTLPMSILTRTSRALGIRARRLSSDHYDDVWLAGEARVVFRGVLT